MALIGQIFLFLSTVDAVDLQIHHAQKYFYRGEEKRGGEPL